MSKVTELIGSSPDLNPTQTPEYITPQEEMYWEAQRVAKKRYQPENGNTHKQKGESLEAFEARREKAIAEGLELDTPVDVTEDRLEFYLLADFPGMSRNFGCSWYDKCLIHAGKKGWKNFSCGECTRFGTSPTALRIVD